VILLTVMLPIRGAFAAAMMCPLAESGHADLVVHGHLVHGGESQLMDAEHEHATPQTEHHLHAGVDVGEKCKFCSVFTVPGLVSAAMPLGEPQLIAAHFPSVYAPPLRFLREGPERPPRSI